MRTEPTQLDLVEAEIDARMIELWNYAMEVEPHEWTLELAWAYCRAGYGAGYIDALTLPKPEELYTRYGFAVPQRAMPCE